MIRLRPALWPTLVSLPILVLSLSLGIWQLERREWKRDILDRIAASQAAPPMTLDQLVSGDPLRHEYGRVTVAGTFEHGRGPELAGPTLALVMSMAGRPSHLGQLTGDGVPVLASRLREGA